MRFYLNYFEIAAVDDDNDNDDDDGDDARFFVENSDNEIEVTKRFEYVWKIWIPFHYYKPSNRNSSCC